MARGPGWNDDEPVERVTSWDELEVNRSRIRGHTREYLDRLEDGELLASHEMNVDGETRVYSPADIFAHVFLHERQPHGDLNTLLYQHGVQPADRGVPVLDT